MVLPYPSPNSRPWIGSRLEGGNETSSGQETGEAERDLVGGASVGWARWAGGGWWGVRAGASVGWLLGVDWGWGGAVAGWVDWSDWARCWVGWRNWGGWGHWGGAERMLAGVRRIPHGTGFCDLYVPCGAGGDD